MRRQPIRRLLSLHLLQRFAERQRFGLRENVRHQYVVMASQRIERLRKRQEIARNQPRPLMNQLVERVLPVGARLAPINRPGLVIHRGPIERYMLTVALHGQLLQIRREALQILLVGQHRDRLRAEKVGVPDPEHAHQHRQIALERRSAEMLVHLVEAVEHRLIIVRSYGQHGRKADAKLRDPLRIRRHRHEMFGDRLLVATQRRLRPIARRVGVRHRFERGKRLRGNNEKRLRHVEPLHRLGEIGAIHVGNEAERHAAIAVMP